MRQAKEDLYCPTPSVTHPLLDQTTMVLVGAHYPENLGAAARAAKTMGVTRLGLVKPSRLAVPSHDMAHKMAVRAWDVLEATQIWDDLDTALRQTDVVFATTSHRGVRGVLSPRKAATLAGDFALRRARISVLFGNEKTGLASHEIERAHYKIRIPMAGDQPSINLAQAVQVIAYEWLNEALERLNGSSGDAPGRR